MSTKPKWIHFAVVPGPKDRKTKVLKVINNESGICIGEVKWYGPFRKYSFFPEPNMVFEATCMQDITNFLLELMEERKKERYKLDHPEQFGIVCTPTGEVSEDGIPVATTKRINHVVYDPNPKPINAGGRIERSDLGKLGGLALE